MLERTVAVKVLAEHLSDDEKFVARFRREALAVAKLIHPNIVQVYDTGVDDGRHYIVMEYVKGKSGAQLLQTRGRARPQIAVEIGVQACAGLEYAHRQGIIHRDVKPGNLMVIGGPAERGGDMTVKLADFGIARAAEQTRLTQVGSVVGTAAYLAPEQARGDEATPASDVYALGVVLYQLLTGRLPYEGATLAELAIRRRTSGRSTPSFYSDDVPAERLRRRPASRSSTTRPPLRRRRELADALRRGPRRRVRPRRRGATRGAPGDDPTGHPPHAPHPDQPPTAAPAPPRRRRQPGSRRPPRRSARALRRATRCSA